MARSGGGWAVLQRRRIPLFLAVLSVSAGVLFIVRSASDSCTSPPPERLKPWFSSSRSLSTPIDLPNPLAFMRSKLVLLVSHELSLSGGPLLLMELAFLLRTVGAKVVWITNQKPTETSEVIYSLEHRMLERGVQDNVLSFMSPRFECNSRGGLDQYMTSCDSSLTTGPCSSKPGCTCLGECSWGLRDLQLNFIYRREIMDMTDQIAWPGPPI